MRKIITISLFTFAYSLFTPCKAQYVDLLTFNGAKGEWPYGSLNIIGSKLYGTAYTGGAHSEGCIFSVDTDGSNYRDLFSFGGGTNGAEPNSPLILSGKVFYGTTSSGGTNGDGNIFSIDTNGTGYRDLFDFNRTNGLYPIGSLTLSGNVLFGVTGSGGAHDSGCIFSIDTSGGNYKDLFDFNGANGENPNGALIFSAGKLYGMTNLGGTSYKGVIFSVDSNGSNFNDLLNFDGTNGANPNGCLTLLGNILYGAASIGGAHDSGCIFSIDTNGNNYKDLFDFDGINGESPCPGGSSLTFFKDSLFGLTFNGGTHHYGCIFSIDTNGSGYTDLYDFTGAGGKNPEGSLTLAEGILYGAATYGGTYNDGVIFSFKDTNITNSINNELIANMEAVNAYPNPNGGNFTVMLQGVNEHAQIEIYNMLGQNIYQTKLNSGITGINLSNQPAGVYLYRVLTENGEYIANGKVIIQK